MITEDAEEVQLSGKELNNLNYYNEWSKLFPVLRYFTYDGCTVDFSKEVKHWKCVKSECGVPIIIRKSIFEEISKKLNDSELWIDKWDDISNLHIFECPLNKMIGVFYPDDYDKPNGVGTFFEKQDDKSEVILEELLRRKGN